MPEEILVYGGGFNPSERKGVDFTSPIPHRLTVAKRYLGILAVPAHVKGFDISHWNTVDSFQAAKDAGYEFVSIKATEGTTIVDSKFYQHWNGALEAGLLVRPYHFFRSNKDGLAQADFFYSQIQDFLAASNQVCLPPGSDIETSDSTDITTRRARYKAHLERIQTLLKKPTKYSSPSLWNSLIGNVTWAKDYWGWVAHWTSADYPTLPYGWTFDETEDWQYGIYPTYWWCEPVPGVSGSVDVDRYLGTLDELRIRAGWVSEPVIPPNALGKVKVTASVLNIRNGPGITYLDKGDTYKDEIWYFFEESGAWVRIGETGWISTGTNLSQIILRY